MLRFAPSPTNAMRVDALRVAIFNYILAKQKNEEFLVRLENSDKEILEILNLFGIEYSHVIEQSDYLKYHRSMALQLLNDKKAFNCFCTPKQIEKDKQEAHTANKVYQYSGRCEKLPADMVIDNENPFSIRIKKPTETIVIEDKIQGKVTFTPEVIDSFMIMTQEKYPTYNFATAVDDMINDISLVIRDKKYLSDTPKQVHIRRALGYTKEIEYAHIPEIIESENTPSVKSLLQEGFLPEAVMNYLIIAGNTTPKEIFTLQEAIEFFKLEEISNEAIKFDINHLREINRQHLLALDVKELSRYVKFADEEIGHLARLYLQDVSTLKELRQKMEPYFGEKNIPNAFQESVQTLRKLIQSAPFFTKYEDFKKYLKNESKMQESTFDTALRFTLTGSEGGPDMVEIYSCIQNYLQEIVKK